jgi:hypothetical protein
MLDRFEQVTWPPADASSPSTAKPDAPVMQVRARARAAWR